MKTELINQLAGYIRIEDLRESLLSGFEQVVPADMAKELGRLLTDDKMNDLKNVILSVMEQTYEVEELKVLLDIHQNHPFFMEKMTKATQLSQVACAQLMEKWVSEEGGYPPFC
jgi:hypothetical protein